MKIAVWWYGRWSRGLKMNLFISIQSLIKNVLWKTVIYGSFFIAITWIKEIINVARQIFIWFLLPLHFWQLKKGTDYPVPVLV